MSVPLHIDAVVQLYYDARNVNDIWNALGAIRAAAMLLLSGTTVANQAPLPGATKYKLQECCKAYNICSFTGVLKLRRCAQRRTRACIHTVCLDCAAEVAI